MRLLGSETRSQLLITGLQGFLEFNQELLELLGMPILKAKGEAEGFCAQLNGEGQVDASIIANSDAFLFGAHCDIIFIWLLFLFLLHIVNMMVMVVVMMMVVLNLDMVIWNWLEYRAWMSIDSRFGHWLIIKSCWLGKSIVSSTAM
ncbi:hypothetical protein RHGRI_011159 [Rhododendron griersonianum]|uniref:XPG-I domain-containing protein n=1 Tax=Rhododendron griersonianum TaxID=479676 RepID=A0AAV6KLS7_9ERIC|nr:hypothetical protein RHGRI_011159 [Rhododendron griersonianum]